MTIKEAALIHSIIEEEIDKKRFDDDITSKEKLNRILRQGISNASIDDLGLISSIIQEKGQRYKKEYFEIKKAYDKALEDYKTLENGISERDPDEFGGKFRDAKEIGTYGNYCIKVVKLMDKMSEAKRKYKEYEEAMNIEF